MSSAGPRIGVAIAAAVVLATGGLTAPSGHAAVTEATGAGTSWTAAPNGVAGRDQVVALRVGGLVRSYRLFVPDSPAPVRYRLVVALHPLHDSALGFETTSDFDAGAVDAHALVVYPDGIAGSWNAGRCCETARDLGVDDVAFLDAVLDDVEATYPVDPAQVAMGGFSNGALMTYRYVCQRSSRVHVAFIGSGALVAPGCAFARPVQILHMHGMRDTVVPWGGDVMSSFTTDHVMPSVRTTTDEIARADGCTAGSWDQAPVDKLVTDYTATGCPTGASVTVSVSRTLPHTWSTGPADVLSYGIDETHDAWGFMLGAWAADAGR